MIKLLLIVFLGQYVYAYAEEIHPLAFSLIPCWISDTESPEVIEINLTAVRKNKNKYDNNKIMIKGEWISFKDINLNIEYKYKKLQNFDDTYKILFVEDAGGSNPNSTEIKYIIEKRTFKINNIEKEIDVLKITEIK